MKDYMKTLHKTNLLILLILFVCSCENTITFNKVEREEKLILNAILSPSQEVNYVYLYSSSIKSPKPILDGEIKLYINEELVETCDEPILNTWP